MNKQLNKPSANQFVYEMFLHEVGIFKSRTIKSKIYNKILFTSETWQNTDSWLWVTRENTEQTVLETMNMGVLLNQGSASCAQGVRELNILSLNILGYIA